MRTLILNSQNIVPNTNNSELVYAFPAGSITIKESQQIALATLQMYYSTFNITALNNNNTYQYVWVDGTIVNVLMPDGFYTLDDINKPIPLLYLPLINPKIPPLCLGKLCLLFSFTIGMVISFNISYNLSNSLGLTFF